MRQKQYQITYWNARLQSGLGWFSVLSLLLLSCAPNQPARNRDAMLPEVDVLQLKENGDVALKLAQQCKAELDNLNVRVTELERTVSQLNSTVQSLPLAQMEEMQGELAVLREELVLLQKSMEERSTAVPTFNPNVKKKTPEVESPAPAEYRSGLAAFEKKSYTEAIRHFDLVEVQSSESPWADDAWFWTGESYLALGDYNRAVSAYQKVFTFTGTDKADDAQFKIAYCFVKMGDRSRAVAEYQKVEVLFPESEYVIKAKAELQKLQSN
ncbi:MAG TPA: tetratricopeptide repeat protein [Fibrobacteraceae bacterium]|nr:tetratricopeptide repeat protein [Fibrobacteraceae bacterium]